MRNAHRSTLALIALTLTVTLLSGCFDSSRAVGLTGLGGWLEKSAIVESVTVSTQPHETEGEPDRTIFTVDLDDTVSETQMTDLLYALDAEMDGHFSPFKGGLVRFGVQPGVNELTVETHAESYPRQFATATELWFGLADDFDTFTVSLPYVHSIGWALERMMTVDLGSASWSETSEALRTLNALGAFELDGDYAAASVQLIVGPRSPWWHRVPAETSFYVGEAPSEDMLSMMESLDAFTDAGVGFDVSGTRDDTLSILAVLPADGSDATGFVNSAGWEITTRIVDTLASSGAPFSLGVKYPDELDLPLANLNSETCVLTTSPFSSQLTDYWRSAGGDC